MDDADLVKAFKHGSREAFSELVKRHSRPLTMMILRMVRSEEDAKDISQTVFLKAFESMPRFLMASSFKSWLYSIALNAVKDHFRKRKLELVDDLADRLVDTSASAAEQLETRRRLSLIRKAIALLPERQRLTLQLRVYEEMDYEEIARLIGGTANGARGNFFQATKTLREKLEPDDEKD
jgi:RNA polymerase sigma-70 factor, ECF subfamily